MAYRLSVAAAALATLAAPLLYGLFVAAVAAAVFIWGFVGLAFARHTLTLLVYLAVLAAGLTVLFFLGKVFFTKPLMDGSATPLEMDEHPALASLIRRVCAATGAPVPVKVAVDMSINASASLIHPIWGLFTGRYRLTLGLPLVAISDQQHMAHVIAHEVGHFSQGGAMRIRQLIHWAQFYLVQIVDGRDRWDVWLARRSAENAYVVRFFAWAAGAGIWLSRQTLRLLLKGILLVNARMSREMEFHADLYAIRVAGSEAFAGSVETFAAGATAMHRAMQIAHRAAAEGRYPDDFPALVAACFAALTAEEKRELTRLGRYTIGTGYDSHPDDTDRLERSERENDAGVLAETGEGTGLFTGFAELCRTQSLKFYESEPKEIVPAAELMDEDRRRDRQDAGRIDFFGAVYDASVWLRVEETGPVPEDDWRAAIEAGDKGRDETLPFFQSTVRAYSKLVIAAVILRRLEAGIAVDWMGMETEPCDVETARGRMYQREREFQEQVEACHTAARPIQRRLVAAWERRDRLGEDRSSLFDRLYQCLRALEAADEPTTHVAVDLAVLSDLGGAINENMQNHEFLQTIQAEFESAVRHAQGLEEALAGVGHPFADADLKAYAVAGELDPASGVYGYLNVYGAAVMRLRDLRLRMMGQIAELALEVEGLCEK